MKDTVHTLTISAVPPPAVEIVWADAEPFFQRAVETTDGVYDIETVRRGLGTGEYVLWVVMDGTKIIAAGTTSIRNYPNAKALTIDWLGGERMPEWLEQSMSVMRSFAKDNGCDFVEGYGRKGWGRALQRFGFEPAYTVYRMELSDGR